MTIPFLDVGAATRELETDIGAAIDRVTRSGWYVGGPEVEAFEQEFAAFTQSAHCIGAGNGLDALFLVLTALDVGPGDEVIVASNGFIATLLSVSMTGARPVLVEPDPVTHNLDPTRVEAAITSRTRVILPTHLYGQPADIDALLAIARKHGLRMVDDAAQAHGATYRGQRIGAHCDAATWSFYPSKNLGALGDAGAVTTNDEQLSRRIRALGNYGSQVRYIHDVRGVNSRLDPIQAAVLRAKLPKLDEWNARRRRIAARYRSELVSCNLGLPFFVPETEPVWHLFVVQSERRDALAAHLAERDVQTLIHYPVPPHRQKAYADLDIPGGSLPIAEALAERVLSLPIGPHLDDESVGRVIDAVRSFPG